jgi:hypothetical protein
VAYCSGLENRRGFIPSVGSNPTPSAKHERGRRPRFCLAPGGGSGSNPLFDRFVGNKSGPREARVPEGRAPWMEPRIDLSGTDQDRFSGPHRGELQGWSSQSHPRRSSPAGHVWHQAPFLFGGGGGSGRKTTAAESCEQKPGPPRKQARMGGTDRNDVPFATPGR